MDTNRFENLGQLRLIPYGVYEASLNMALDHLLLAGQSMALRLYGWERATLSLGRNQKDFSDLNHSALFQCDLVRRETGGQAVLHHHELTYSFVGSTPPLPKGVLDSYQFLAEPLTQALTSLGIEVTSGEYRKFKPQGSHCFLEPSAYELLLQGKKLIGSAQKRQGSRLLQHGSILLKRDINLWAELWPNANLERFISLEEGGYSPEMAPLAQAITEAFSQLWQGQIEIRNFSESELIQAKQIAKQFEQNAAGL